MRTLASLLAASMMSLPASAPAEHHEPHHDERVLVTLVVRHPTPASAH